MIDGYKTVNELAAEWEVNPRTIQTMCANGRIQGAVKFGRDWAVPADVERPTDRRVVSGEYKDWRKRTADRQIMTCRNDIVYEIYSKS